MDPHSLGRQAIDPQPRHPGGAARAAGCGGTLGVFAPQEETRPVAVRVEVQGREEQQ